MLDWSLTTTAALLVLIAIINIHKCLKRFKFHSDASEMRVLLSPMTVLGAITPTFRWNPGLNWCWEQRATAYVNHTHEVISLVPILYGRRMYYLGSLNLFKQLLFAENKLHIEKPQDMLKSMLAFGDNLFTANGDVWKRQRRIMGPAFTHSTFQMVLKETKAVVEEMAVAEGWVDRHEGNSPDFNKITAHTAMIVLGRCVFGLPFQWADTRNDGEDKLTFEHALRSSCESHIERLFYPRWLYRLPIQRLRFIDAAWTSLGTYMRELIVERKEELGASGSDAQLQRGDIFTRLVAGLSEDAKVGLEEQQVIGNTFILMFTGHETTARALAATVGYLAIHQDEQQRVLDEIQHILPDDRDPTLFDLEKLNHLLYCFYEGLRLHPPGPGFGRVIMENVTLHLQRPQPQALHLQKGDYVMLDYIGALHDPNTFPDPEEFRPSRWRNIPDHDVAMFGLGPRACLGRKFAQTEALTFLVTLLRTWKVDIDLQDGETRQAFERRIMDRSRLLGLAFGVEKVPVKIRRRL
ncbi:unnamed protein product [Somion occarium]|uniref:Cytochrome P450 n=1 Tax=Somion occarium TaxID=3059160 RepID=A0ABP1DVA2_9APHY